MTRPLEGATVLIVEDEFLILLDLEHTLAGAGAEITTATSVEEATAVARQSFDAAVLDVRLPDGDVYPVAHMLLARDVPLVFHSGHAHNENLQEAFPSAIALEKPVRERVLIAALERQIARTGAS